MHWRWILHAIRFICLRFLCGLSGVQMWSHTHMSTQRQRKHEVLVFAFWVVGCSALNKHGSECVRMASWYKLARRISSLRQEYRDYSSGLFLCGPQVASNGMNRILFGFLCFSMFFSCWMICDDLCTLLILAILFISFSFAPCWQH